METPLFAFPEELSGKDIRYKRLQLGFTQSEFASLLNVSVKTIERWEKGEHPITGPVVPLLILLSEERQLPEKYRIPEKKYPLRLWYMKGNQLCTLIDVDERDSIVEIHNYTSDYMKKAFGRVEKPDYAQYVEFLESRCFPKSRDRMKLILKELDLPFYDPLLIIEKTEGRMAEDQYYIKIERN